jgi:hypothetical protein
VPPGPLPQLRQAHLGRVRGPRRAGPPGRAAGEAVPVPAAEVAARAAPRPVSGPPYSISIVPQRVPFDATGQPSAAQASKVPFAFAIAMNCSLGWFAHLSGKYAQRSEP